MAERDPLRERFAAFRDQSEGAARPPDPEMIPVVLRRRKRRRLIAAAAAIVAVLALALLPNPGDTPRPPDPSVSDTATPTVTTEQAPTSAPPPTTTAGSPNVPAGRPAGSTTTKPSKCATPLDGAGSEPTVNGNEVLNGVPYSIRPSDYFDQCPAYRLRFVEARYVWDRNRQLIVLAASTERYLTKASPTVAAPKINELPGLCGEGFVALQTTKPIPTTIPNSVQDTPGAYLNLLQKHAYAAFSHWIFPTSTQARSNSSCGPPAASPSTSPTP
ncbi:hypothetical protein [Dactylosporangium sp. CA-092794]|uniref:hypothetical protein n=1 Tax=Dactylosporangium sp. CA-092794 TaxID=3239929 RepID=UPI003D8CC42E